MRRPRSIVAALLVSAPLLLSACGGSSDSRPPTIVAGNVRSVAAGTASAHGLRRLWLAAAGWWRSEAVAQVPGIAVEIQGTSTNTHTDSQGFFRLDGNHFGPAVVVFTGNGASGAFPLTLPAGGEVDLLDVGVLGSQVTVAQQRIRFTGPITGVDCAAQLLQVLSGELVPFRTRFQSTTPIVDQDGAPLRCADLIPGRTADVEGTVAANGDVNATRLQENPSQTAAAPQTLHGSLVSSNCPTTLIVMGDQGNFTVNIGPSTAISDTNSQLLACGDLLAGDFLQVVGSVTSLGVDASQVKRLPSPTPTTTATTSPASTPTPTPST